MAEAFVASQLIGQPIHVVWDALVDWERSHLWMAVESVEADRPTEIGTVLNVSAKGRRHQSRITAILPGRSMTLEASQRGATVTYTYLCERSGDDRTRIDLVANCEIVGPMKIVAPLFRRSLRRTDRGQLKNLRDLLETD